MNLKTSTLIRNTLMATLLVGGSLLIAPVEAKAANNKSWTFTYKFKSNAPFQIKKSASSKDEAFKSAAKDCFQKLTGGNYPGESLGLDYIDVCANPKM